MNPKDDPNHLFTAEEVEVIVDEATINLGTELAETNAARDKAEAKCAAYVQAWMPVTGRYSRIEALVMSDNPGQPLLDRLHRAEALIAGWRKISGACLGEIHGECSCHAYDDCADELEQALKGEPHA